MLESTRFYVITTVLVIVGIGVLCLGLPSLRIDSDVRNVVPKEHPELVYCDEVDDTFGSADAIVVGVDSPAGLTPGVVELVRTITTHLSDRYEDVNSIASADTIVARGTTLEPEHLVDDGPVTEESLRNLERRLQDWPFFDNLLVSADHKAVSVMVQIKRGWTARQKEEAVDVVRGIVEADVAASGQDVRAVYTGEPVVDQVIGTAVDSDMKMLTPLALVAVLVTLFLSLRSLAGVLGPVLTVLLSMAATFGLMGLLGRPVMIITSAVPVFLVAVGTAYGIHIASHYRRYRDAGSHRLEAVRRTVTEVGGAVLVAATTTIAGFASLGTSEIGPVRDFGLFLAFGVTVALLLSFTMVPLLLAATDRSGPADSDETPRGKLALALARMAGFSVRKRWAVVAAVVLLMAGMAGTTAALLRVDQESVGLFPAGSVVRESDRLFATRFGGTHTLSVVLAGPGSRSMVDPAALTFLEGLQRHVETHPQVGKTMSLADYVRRMNRVMHRGQSAYDSVPPERNLIAQYIQLYELSGDTEDFESVVDFDYASARLLVQVRDGRAEVASEVRKLVDTYAAAHLPSGYGVRMAGTMVRYDVINRFIVSGQMWSLLSSLLMVFVMVAMLFWRSGAGSRGNRSAAVVGLSSGALTLVPITIAVVVNFGMMSLLDIPLDISTALIANCAVGIGIDYSVHLMHRYRAMRAVGKDAGAALEAAAAASGRPIVFNAVAVAVGFLTLLPSGFIPLRALAWLTATTMIVSAASALLVLPALLYFRDGERGAIAHSGA